MLYSANFCVIDCETGGFSSEKNPIVEIAVVILNYKLEEVGRYDSLIRPYDDSLEITDGALQANGLTREEIDQGEDIKVVVKELCTLFNKTKGGKKSFLVCHNTPFDIKFIEAMFKVGKQDIYKYIDKQTLDTLVLSRLAWGHDNNTENHKLRTACKNAGIELINAHRAMADTVATAELFRYFMSKLRGESKEITTSKPKAKFRDTFKI